MKKVIVLIGVLLTGILPRVSMAETDGARGGQAFVNEAAREGKWK